MKEADRHTDRIRVKPVATKQMMKDFVNLPRLIYAGSPYYVPDLDQDIIDTFDPRKNHGLEYSEVQPFVAYDIKRKPVGRIAAIINKRANEKWGTRNVRFGLMEFIDDLQVSRALLEAVAEWGRAKGMTAMQGPLGIFDFDKEGMLVEDFDMMGSMVTIYNPPYYPEHMQQLGFVKEVDWIQLQMEVPEVIPARYTRVANYVSQQMGLHVRKLTRKELLQGGYGHKIFNLLNLAYAPLFGYTEFTHQQIDDFLKRYVPLMEMRMISAVEKEDGELIGVAVTMHSLSEALRKSQGKLWPWGWWHLLKAVKWKHEPKAEMLLIAVHPSYQGLGVNALFFTDLVEAFHQCGITWAETGPQLEDNWKELSQWKALNPKPVKRRRCFTKRIE